MSDHQPSDTAETAQNSTQSDDHTDNPLSSLAGHDEMAYTLSATQKALEDAGVVSGDVITRRHDIWGREFDHLDHDLANAIVDACVDWLQEPSTLRVVNIVKTDGAVVDGIVNVTPGEEQCNISLAEK